MGKNVCVVLAEGFEETEAVVPIDMLRRAGVHVTITSLGATAEPVSGAHGITIRSDAPLRALTPSSFDACVLPGGQPGTKNLARSAELAAFIKDMSSQKKIIAAICAAPAMVLAPLGLLDGRTATCYPDMFAAFPPSSTFIDQPVVIDGRLITSQGPGTALAFAYALVEALTGPEITRKLRAATLSP